jgi:Rieske Fe-S protein
MNRRTFMHRSCAICVTGGMGALALFEASCASFPAYETSVREHAVSIPRSAVDQTGFLLVRPKELTYNIGLRRTENGSYQALLLLCTHAENQLDVTGNGYRCPLHGSGFDIHGKVTRGPAQRSLRELSTTVANDTIVIQCPPLDHA